MVEVSGMEIAVRAWLHAVLTRLRMLEAWAGSVDRQVHIVAACAVLAVRLAEDY